MNTYFGFDAHKHYSIIASIDDIGSVGPFVRVENDRGLFRRHLKVLPPGSKIAIETIGNWHLMVDDIEEAGHIPLIANAGMAKEMMGQINKTDKLDAKGLALLLRNGTLPSVWIPPSELRDQRELPRMRVTLVRTKMMLKNGFMLRWQNMRLGSKLSKSPFRPPGSKRERSHEVLSLEKWMRSSAGKMLMLLRQRIHASDETGIERRGETQT